MGARLSSVDHLSNHVRTFPDMPVDLQGGGSRLSFRANALAGALSVLVVGALVPMPGDAGVLHAQAGTQLPPQLSPPTRDQLTPPEMRREERSVTLTIDGGFERSPCVLDRAEYSDITFMLSGVEFSGLDIRKIENAHP